MPKDETTKDEQDKLQGAGRTSGGKGGTTSKGKLYTEEQIAKIKSDAAADAGRQRKSAELERDQLKDQLQSLNKRLDELESQRSESNLAEARNDPDKLRNYQNEQSLNRLKRELDDKYRELARREAQVEEDEAQTRKMKREATTSYNAIKHGLTFEELDELNIEDPDTQEKVAEKLGIAKRATKPAAENEGEGEDEWSPDSGDMAGGVDNELTSENIENMSMKALEKQMEKTSE